MCNDLGVDTVDPLNFGFKPRLVNNVLVQVWTNLLFGLNLVIDLNGKRKNIFKKITSGIKKAL